MNNNIAWFDLENELEFAKGLEDLYNLD